MTPTPSSRHRVPLIALSSLLLFSCVSTASSRELEIQGTKVPVEITCSDFPLVLNGTAVRKKFGFSVYLAALYLSEQSRDDETIMKKDRRNKRVHITMLREVSAHTFNSTIQKNIDVNFSTDEKREYSKELDDFLGCFRGGSDLKKGSTIDIDFVPEIGMLISVDGKAHEAIPGEDFYHAILRLWIGNPPQESLKTGLLGLVMD